MDYHYQQKVLQAIQRIESLMRSPDLLAQKNQMTQELNILMEMLREQLPVDQQQNTYPAAC